jgi:hypothetical protein
MLHQILDHDVPPTVTVCFLSSTIVTVAIHVSLVTN